MWGRNLCEINSSHSYLDLIQTCFRNETERMRVELKKVVHSGVKYWSSVRCGIIL